MNTTNNKLSLEVLRKNNKRVIVEHYRKSIKNNCLLPSKFFKITGNQSDIDAKSGLSIVTIEDNDGQFRIGMAKCHKNDAFNRKRGLMMAINRIKAV